METNNKPSQMLQLQISKDVLMIFFDVPSGFRVSGVKLEQHKIYRIGYLKSFDRVKILKGIRKKHEICLQDFFKDKLIKAGWDFDKYKHPYAFYAVLKNKNK